MFTAGDRVEMIKMPHDPNPIPAGAQGTVRESQSIDLGRGNFWKVDVDWDDGRTLGVVIPPDEVRKL